ncbi:flavin reductase family protein [Mesorhizobium sp. J428]|uniref:flavin reductase family protein n=1 Tax=Mesorhizobium sp. J428 TaxID=2898440 RepID=UPI002150B605|nr:flavin reductase family protein [Mesorhizobium sp. J428]MCR5857637.1 flavin reductase family protein [Mesorhizobium sp. J428]
MERVALTPDLRMSRNPMFADAGTYPSDALPRLDPKALRSAFGKFATGLTVVTAASDDGPVGITANSFYPVSLDPPLVLWSIARCSRRFRAFADARFQTIHILGSDQVDLGRRFFHDGRDFSGLDTSAGIGDVPLIDGALARLECEIVRRVDCGDHLVLIG